MTITHDAVIEGLEYMVGQARVASLGEREDSRPIHIAAHNAHAVLLTEIVKAWWEATSEAKRSAFFKRPEVRAAIKEIERTDQAFDDLPSLLVYWEKRGL